jgi:hypothetical protein
MENHIQPAWVALSERVYTALLALYPAEFRRDYARWMAQAFRDVTRDTYRREGSAGLALWWGSALFDLAISVIEQRRKEPLVMPKSILPDWAGRLLIAGGICLALASISQFQPGSHNSYTGIYQISIYFLGPAYLFIGLACLGLPTRYRERFEPLSRITLYVAGFGALLSMASFLMTPLISEWFWAVAMIGLILHIIGMVVFGFANITRPFIPGIRTVPLMTGILPFLMVFTSQGRAYGGTDWGGFAYLFGAGLSWFIIGYFVNREKTMAPLPAAA